MSVPRRRILPLVLAHAAAAGALNLSSCDNSAATSAPTRSEEVFPDARAQTVSMVRRGDAVRGEALYVAKCDACHSVNQNRIGPKHRGVFGRRVGGVDDYEYSAALTNVDLIWNEETLDEWLRGPTKMFPGTRMGFAVSDDQERADMIAYLQSLSE